ncbi:hypothetical protein IWQ57_002966 [Coemansia nantahalensis]|uniref:Uncharacterized protein n=1 Tax=Coemansia nantahalensis TaxID=2789366 RepID=A0ACC1JYP0_9FUNG|nr:hypothetical protein IWQ57_002966 [Coemansia nantahalensis]
MSYPSNMAVNLASEANEINSRTLSTSLHEIASHATPAPHTPTALDAPAPLRGPDSAPLALKSDAATCAMPTANRGIDDDGGGGDGEGPQNSDQAAETESMGSVVALRIANRHTNGPTGGSSKSDDDDDNQPLVCLTRKPSERPGQETLRVCVATNAVGAEPPGSGGNVNNDDDDDRPLSALLLQSQTAGEDLGCLPLPPLVHDPDAPADLDDIVNESPTPLRTSIGSRLAAQGVARKSSLLSRAFHPELDEDGATAAPRRIRRPHRDRHSTPLSVPQSPGEAQMATEAPYNSLPRPPKARAIDNDASDGGNTSDGRYREAAAADGVEPAVLDRASGEAGRPWLRDQDYSVSDSSLSTNRRAKRGSALGQQLTEDLQRVRREIARERREADMSVRHSWQIGTLEAVPRPWMRDVHTLSDSALAKEAQVASQAAAATANNAVAHSDVPETQPAWPFASRARPMSTQNNHRLSRLYGWAAGGGRRSNSMPLGDDGEQMAAPVARSWLGRLKRTLRPGSTCIE